MPPKSNQYCCVYGCKSLYGSQAGISLHGFPVAGKSRVEWTSASGSVSLIDRKKAWMIALKSVPERVTKWSKVCSLHFSSKHFFPSGIPRKAAGLKRDAVPDQVLPECPRPEALRKKLVKRSFRTLQHHHEQSEVAKEGNEDDYAAAEALIQLLNVPASPPPLPQPEPDISTIEAPPVQKTFADAGTQVTSGDITVPFVSFIRTDEQLNSMTGLPSFSVVMSLVEACQMLKKDDRVNRLSLRERIILTMIKLKLNISFVVLSILFKCVSNVKCRVIFKDTLKLLSVVLREAVVWPSQTAVRNTLPKCFANFPKVRIVLDCTEIPVQQPKCLQCRVKLYSQYKGGTTVKFMTAVAPSGLLTYVSEPFGGRCSDKFILESSQLLARLEKDDHVMTDKGFHIEDACNFYGVTLVRPPFLRAKKGNPQKQFSKEESKLTREIAKARVHVERANQRIKIFKFFSSQIEWSQINVVHEAFIVVSGITNLSAPILSESQF